MGVRLGLTVVAVLLATGCVGGAKGTCGEGLSLSVSDPSAGVVVDIYGPDGLWIGALAADESLEAVPAGSSYEIRRGWTGAAVAVGALDLGAGQIEDCAPVLSVEVSDQPTAGALWTSSWEQLLALAGDASGRSLAASPLVPLTNSFNALAIDAIGDLWAATPWTYGARFVVLSPGQQAGAGEVTPALELVAPSLVGDANFTSLNFDPAGNLWATSGTQIGGFVGVLGWSAEALHAARLQGGIVEMEPTWAQSVSGATTLSGAAFSPAGDLFVTAEDEGQVLRLAGEELRSGEAGVSAAPTISPANALSLWATEDAAWRGLTGLSPGAEGGIAVLAATSGAVLHLPAADLEVDGERVVVGTQMGVTSLPHAITDDGEGGVWFSDTGAVGFVAAPGEVETRIEVPEIERAGAIFLDVDRSTK